MVEALNTGVQFSQSYPAKCAYQPVRNAQACFGSCALNNLLSTGKYEWTLLHLWLDLAMLAKLPFVLFSILFCISEKKLSTVPFKIPLNTECLWARNWIFEAPFL